MLRTHAARERLHLRLVRLLGPRDQDRRTLEENQLVLRRVLHLLEDVPFGFVRRDQLDHLTAIAGAFGRAFLQALDLRACAAQLVLPSQDERFDGDVGRRRNEAPRLTGRARREALLLELLDHPLQLSRRQREIAFELGRRRAGAVEERFVDALLDLADPERFERTAKRCLVHQCDVRGWTPSDFSIAAGS